MTERVEFLENMIVTLQENLILANQNIGELTERLERSEQNNKRLERLFLKKIGPPASLDKFATM